MTDFSFLDKGGAFTQTEEKPAVTTAETPATDTAVVDTPEKTTEATPALEADKSTPEQPTFDFSKVLGGKFKSEEELNAVINEHQTYKSEIDTLNKKVTEYGDYIKPADEFVKKYNEIKSKGGDVNLFLAVQPLDVKSLSDSDAEKFRLVYEEGFKPHEADREVKFVYQTDKSKSDFEKIIKQEEEKGEDADPKIIQQAKSDIEAWEYKQDRLARAGRNAKEFIENLKVKSEQTPDTEKAYNDNLDTWNTNKKLPETITHKFTIGENGTTKELSLEFKLDKEGKADLNEFYSSIADYNAKSGIPYQDATDLLEQRIWAKNGAKIASEMVKTALDEQKKSIDAKLHNPSVKKEETKNTVAEKSEADKVAGEVFSYVKSR